MTNTIRLAFDGDHAYALFGENLQVGKAAFVAIGTLSHNDALQAAYDKLVVEYPELKGFSFEAALE